MHRNILAVAIAGLLATAGIGLAQTADDAELQAPRQLVMADEARDWQAVGRLDLGRSGFCTGVLISEVHVLTAAHCMYSKATGQTHAPARIVFKAGLRNGRAVATRRARRFAIAEDYEYDDTDKIRRIASDLAVVELELPISGSVVTPLQTGIDPGDGRPLTIVSYAAGREDAPALQEGCERLGMRDNVMVYSCDVTFGASGSPVFVDTDDGPRIASVMSAMAQWKDRPVSLAAALESSLDGLIARLALVDPVARTIAAVPITETLSISRQLGRAIVSAEKKLPQIRR